MRLINRLRNIQPPVTGKPPQATRRGGTGWRWQPLQMFALLLTLSTVATAQPNGQVSIEADSLELDQQSGMSIYRGNVHLQQGGLSLRADRLELQTRQGELVRAYASGKPVRLEQRNPGDGKLTRAEATEVEYRFSDGILELMGDARLWRDGDEFSGKHLIFERDKQVVRAFGDDQGEGDGRVRVILTPQQGNGDE